MATPQLQRIADDIFSGSVTWTDHKLGADGFMTSAGTSQGVPVARRVDKRQGSTYGEATYVATLGGKDESFHVADPVGKRIALDGKKPSA